MPSTISTIENAFALVPTPVSMGSNEVYPSSDNKTLSLNQARRTSVRTSKYRGVARHKWTGRYEAYLWDNSFIKEGHKRKGRQGGYGTELEAARAYDKAALKYWGDKSTINFPITDYKEELEVMKQMTTVDYTNYLKRKSSGFTRGESIYRGVTRHNQKRKWQARIGRINGNKDVYLGAYSTEEEAAVIYDIATIKFRGNDSVTNFDKRFYSVAKN
ncbi:AP2-like ethylene-responsive transcription factor CRL5 [Cryptomeria japonica]|uniref:AP2-like ethylene-responsive transcription factor CRL5 n=1 Tax=Cryptomeria japonica TaxID=3369 RepID=UPI0025AD6D48|nr:AP2-like ethylene-responsive transcription factor CRL5 [Cryptomeria japonica]